MTDWSDEVAARLRDLLNVLEAGYAVIECRNAPDIRAALGEIERLRAALEAYDTLSLVIESAMRNEVGLDPRAAGHYERLCAVILLARAALRGGGK